MIQKYSTYVVLEKFFDFPTRVFGVRELSRLTHLSQPSVQLHLKKLVKGKLIQKVKDRLYGGYKSNRENESFKILKIQNCVYRLHSTGCTSYIRDTIQPRTIILFGSCSRGEDVESSDIDLFIEAKEEKIDVRKYEKTFNRRINIFFKENFSELSNELKNSIINGIKLYGYLEVF